MNVTYGSSMPNAVAPTKYCYEFKGYYTEEDGKGTQYYDSNMKSIKSYDIGNDTILYVYWEYLKPNKFETDTWETIICNVRIENTSKYNVGDTKEVHLEGFGYHTLRIANK